MESPNEPILGLAPAEQRDPEQRRFAEDKSLPPIHREILFQLPLALYFRNAAPIVFLKRHLNLGINLLHRLIGLIPLKCGAQNFVPLESTLPGAVKGGWIQFVAQSANDLLDIHPRFRGINTMKQHPLLHGRQGVNGFRFGFMLAHANAWQPGAARTTATKASPPAVRFVAGARAFPTKA